MTEFVKLRMCDFCGKTADFVRVLVAGPKADICDECVELAAKIVAERDASKDGARPAIKAVEPALHQEEGGEK